MRTSNASPARVMVTLVDILQMADHVSLCSRVLLLLGVAVEDVLSAVDQVIFVPLGAFAGFPCSTARVAKFVAAAAAAHG